MNNLYQKAATTSDTISSTKDVSVQIGLVNSAANDVTVLSEKSEEKINHNKPWRVVIRRKVDGGSCDEDISGDNIGDQPV